MHGSTQHRSCHLIPCALAGLALCAASSLHAHTPSSPLETIDLSAHTLTDRPRTIPPSPFKTPSPRHTLCQAIALAEQEGGTAIGARLELRRGAPIIVVELTQPTGPEHPSTFALWSADPTAERWLPSRFTCQRISSIAQLQAQHSTIRRTPLCLLEAVTLAQCLSGGDLQAITPVLRHNRPFFRVTIRDDAGLFTVCLLDPETCDLCPDL